MAQPRFLAPALVVLVTCSILAAGCTGQNQGSQPPASTMTIPTTRPVTPVEVTTLPGQPATIVTTIPSIVVTPQYTPGTVLQAGSAILIQGDVIGYKSAVGNFIDEIRFNVVKAPRADPVTFDVPNTQIIFTKGGQQYGVNYLILSGDLNGNRILEDGETFQVSIPFTSEASQYAIYAGQMFTMTIQNPPQPRVTIVTGAPSVLQDSNILARATA